MTYGFIYETTNLVTGKKYIGSHVRTQNIEDPDDSWYLGSGKLIGAAINKYGKENFSRVILEECNSKEEIIEAERKHLQSVDAANNPSYYNLSNEFFGGDGKGENSRMWGKKASKSTRLKHSIRMSKNNPMKDKDVVKKNIDAHKGKKRKPRSEESNLKSSLSMLEWQNSEEGLRFRDSISKEFSGSGNPFYDHHHNENSLKLIGAANRGTIYVHNDVHTKRIKPELLDSYIAKGYVLGMLPRNTKKGCD